MKITLVAGARPNFMKIAPIVRNIEHKKAQGCDITYSLVHTGQHYDNNMSTRFFIELDIPMPDVNLGAGSGTQAEQTAAIMVGFEKYLLENPADLVVVVGDVNSTMACAIVAKKLNIKVAHIEAGLRSGDMTMPEEINRIVTDSITDYFFTTSEEAGKNLRNEGVPSENIFWVGNTMIDSLLSNLPRLRKPTIWEKENLSNKGYFVITLHRPANVDQEGQLINLLNGIIDNSQNLPIIFPVHPRTQSRLRNMNIESNNLLLVEPMGYLEFIYLVRHAKAIVTDSGGITEEASVLGVPCMTLRNSTERPETVELGTNVLLGTDPSAITPAMKQLFAGEWKKGGEIPFWDGKASERIVNHLLSLSAQ